jgi:hypothetical protein
MASTVLANGSKEARSERPQRLPKPSAVLLQQLDSGIPILPSQQQAILAFRAAESTRRAAETKLAIEEATANSSSEPPSQATTQHLMFLEQLAQVSASRATSSSLSNTNLPTSVGSDAVAQKETWKRAYFEDSSEDDEELENKGDNEREDARINANPTKCECE